MSEERRLTRMVYDAFVAVVETGRNEIHPGDIVQFMREQNHPMGIWNVNGELTKLRGLGVVRLDDDNATWTLIPGVDFEEASLKPNGEATTSSD